MSHIESLLSQYQQSLKANDIEGLMGIYHENIVMFDCWQDWSYEGKKAVQKMVEYWLEEIKNEKTSFEISNLQVHKSEAVEYATFDGHIVVQGPDGQASKTSLRYTVCATNEEGWKIKHQHSSQPIE